jgi:hypothetical protein
MNRGPALEGTLTRRFAAPKIVRTSNELFSLEDKKANDQPFAPVKKEVLADRTRE